ncbi:non-ribosomal peptide synthetase [Nonomuraea sp. NPDC003754]
MTARRRRLWEQWVLDPDGPWHTVTFTIDLAGAVDRTRLEGALAAFPCLEVPVPVRLTPSFLVRDRRVAVTLPAQTATPGEFVQAVADAYAGRAAAGGDEPTARARAHWRDVITDPPVSRIPVEGSPGAGPGVIRHRFEDAAPESVLAALAAVLGRWTRSRDLLIGVPEGFVRIDIDDTASLSDLVDQVRERRGRGLRHAGAFRDGAHQVMEDAGIRHLPAVHFADAAAPPRFVDAGPLTLIPRVPPHGAVGSSLTIGMDDTCFDARDIDEATAERLLHQVERLLAADPRDTLSAISLMGEAERTTVVGRFSRTAEPAASSHVLHELIAGPDDAVAVVCGTERITYGQLDRRSALLARRLRDLGVRGEDVVGVRLPRSVDLIVAFLGVLKAGAAYLPLDPGHPADRLAFMTADARAEIVIDGETLDALRSGSVPAAPHGRRQAEAGPDRLAYVIYTSGSSGRPKGVQVEHRQIVASTIARYPVFPGPIDSYLALAGPAFDALGAGVYLTLTRAGTLVLPTDDEVGDPWLLGELITRERVTHVDGVPGQYAALLDAAPDSVAGLRCAVVGGEVCPPALVTRHNEVTREAVLINEYGPTETTVWATSYTCDRGEPPARSVPIGRPMPGALAYVLDERLAPVPIGVPGELCIGGAGVARGYVGRPDLTASRFVANPFAAGVVYRTGDLVRWRPDGDLEFLGRLDEQINMRGLRVEPAEIEQVISRHPQVREVAVVAARAGDHHRLDAYVVATGAAALSRPELSAHTGRFLPASMVPATWTVLDRMPRTGNGKLDRAALPPPRAAAHTSGKATGSPATAVQRAVVELFTTSLGEDSDLRTTVPAWTGQFFGPADLTARFRLRFGDRVPPITTGLSAGRLATALRRLDSTDR